MTQNKKGIALIFVLIVLVALSGVTLAFWYMTNSALVMSAAQLNDARAFYIAEAGHDMARYRLANGSTVPYTETNTTLGAGTYTVTAVYSDAPTNSLVTITSDGYVPNSTKPVAHRQFIEKNISSSRIDLSLAATATSSGAQASNPATNVNNNNDADYWQQQGGSSPYWVRLDYGSAKTISRVTVIGSGIASCVVQWSVNGSSGWTAVSGASGTFNATGGTRTFTAVTQRYFRLSMTRSGTLRINSYKSYASTGGGALGKGTITTSG